MCVKSSTITIYTQPTNIVLNIMLCLQNHSAITNAFTSPINAGILNKGHIAFVVTGFYLFSRAYIFAIHTSTEPCQCNCLKSGFKVKQQWWNWLKRILYFALSLLQRWCQGSRPLALVKFVRVNVSGWAGRNGPDFVQDFRLVADCAKEKGKNAHT